jgi:hypothetical protein
MILSLAIKATLGVATIAAATTGAVVLVKKNDKVGKLYEDKMPVFFKNQCKKIEDVVLDTTAAFKAAKTVAQSPAFQSLLAQEKVMVDNAVAAAVAARK